MVLAHYTLILILLLAHKHHCDLRFIREELGYADRLRFTSGIHRYYNCTVLNKMLKSNLKIGIYTYDLHDASKLHYELDDVDNFAITTRKLQDFYFADVTVRKQIHETYKVVKLTAIETATSKILDVTELRVHVKQKTKTAPRFLHGKKTITLQDDALLGSVVGRVVLEKAPSRAIVYMEKNLVSKINEFSIAMDGRIFLMKQLKAEKKNFFALTVKARYTDSEQFSSLGIDIIVKPNDKSKSVDRTLRNVIPSRYRNAEKSRTSQLTRREYVFHVSELVPKASIVANLGFVQDGVRFFIADGDAGGIFQIDRDTGVLYILDAGPLDYEKRKEYSFTVVGILNEKARILEGQIKILIVDENDNKPVFKESVYYANLEEGLAQSSEVIKVVATDKDDSYNGRISYYISNKEKIPFTVDDNGSIKSTQNLKFPDVHSRYYLYLTAIDWGKRFRHETEVLVEITIESKNTHVPLIKQKFCEFVLSNTEVSTSLFRFNAIDQDINDKLSFNLQSDQHDGFTIDANSGVAAYRPEKDVKSATIYIIVEDGVHTSVKTMVSISFKKEGGEKTCIANQDFEKVAEMVTKFNTPFPANKKVEPTKAPPSPIRFAKGDRVFSVKENAPLNTVIVEITAVDSNIDCHGMLLFTIESGNVGHKFQIDLFNGSLYVLNSLDRETKDMYKLKIKAADMMGRYETEEFIVKIQDVNDNAPVFTNNGTYHFNVQEDWQVNRKIDTVRANDADLSTKQIFYSLVNPSELFTLNVLSGDVFLKSSLADQPYLEYFIQIQASDRSQVEDRQGFGLIHIVLSETVNHRPMCLTHNQHIEVPNDSPVGVVVGRIFGYDQDTGTNGKLSYVIKSARQLDQFGDYLENESFNNYFQMNRRSGMIRLIKPLPVSFEKFKIDITLTDGAGLSASCLMHATVTEGLGDIVPTFDHSESPLIVDFAEGSPIGSQIVNLVAKVPGHQAGKGIKYFIVDGNGISDFIIKNENSGIVSNVNSHFSQSSYWLTVQAILESNPSSFKNTHILIKINSQTVMRPFFYPSVHFVTVFDDIGVDNEIIQLYTVNHAEKNVYAIYTGNEKQMFDFNSNGAIVVKRPLNSDDSPRHYDLNVTVTSLLSNDRLFSYGSVHITVERNDDPPEFGFSTMPSITLFESSGQLHPPYQFQVLALNKKPDQLAIFVDKTTYDGEPIFNINPSTGTLTTNQTLKAGDESLLTIKTKNAAGKESSSSCWVGFAVVKRPEQPTKLKFKKSRYSVSIAENEVGNLIDFEEEMEVSTDGYVFFYILSENERQQFYFPLTDISMLTVLNPLDYERQARHTIRILAFDGRSFAEAEVSVTVENINDNPPSASQACYEASVREGFREAKESVLNVKVIDPDHLNEQFKYELTNKFDDNFPFSVDASNGTIMVNAVPLDRELRSQYIITVVASNQVESTDFCVKVEVEDLNDNRPSFVREVFEMQLVDTTTPATTVMVVYAVDKDIGVNGEILYSFAEKNEYFDIDSKYGFIYVKQPLSQVSGTTFNIKLVGKDKGTPALSSYATAKITVVSDPNNMWFSSGNLTETVSENTPPGSLIIRDIRVENTEVNYQLARKQGECYSNLWVEPFTGIVLIKNPLDAEMLSQCMFSINGIIRHRTVTSMDVLVAVEDRNDNIPVVQQSAYFGNVSEALSSSTPILDKDNQPLVIKATDKDSGPNGEICYSIIENIAKIYFAIDEVSGEIKTNKVLDYETHPKQFDFHVKVSDQGMPRHSVIVPVTIYLNDVNDRIPYFRDNFPFTLRLPVYDGMVVGRVQAVDDDTTPQTPLKYTLPSYNTVRRTQEFTIDSLTGEIRVKDANKLQKPSRFTLEVGVSDGTFSGKTQVPLQFIAFKPDAQFKFPDKIYQASLAEDVNSFSVVKFLHPVGYERSEKLSFQLLNPIAGFDVVKHVGAVVTNDASNFDYERQKFYLLHVEGSYGNKYARTTVNVSLKDVNDNAPVFEKKRYYHVITDIDTTIGSKLISVEATDEDSGDNGRVSYKMLTKEAYFECNPTTGAITLEQQFVKSHTKPEYTLIIEARDHGTPALTALTTVEINVQNEDQPRFSQKYEVRVDEDAFKGYTLLTVRAKGPNERQVFYQIYSGDDMEVFEIGFTTGKLKLAGYLDYKKKTNYKLEIKAIDSLTGSWSLAKCLVKVNDVNDNYPFFEKVFYETKVSEDASIGTAILTVTARDDDSGDNSLISYSIMFRSSHFAINSTSGAIYTTALLDAESSSLEQLHIIAEDNGKVSKSIHCTVSVQINDVNDNKPVFLQPKYEFFVDRFLKPGQFVGRVIAEDLDASSKQVYSLKSQSDFVNIHPKTGILKLTENPPQLSTIKLQVKVTDGKYESTVDVEIESSARNDNRPLALETIRAEVEENTEKSVLIATIMHRDQDEGKFGNVTYQIDSELAQKYFKIDNDGVLRTTGVAIDREQYSNFVVPVRVTDLGGKFSLVNVHVDVLDQNDNIPTFEYPLYQTTITDSQMSDESLLGVYAVDEDEGSNADIVYNPQGLRAGTNVPLFVDSKKGLVSLSGRPIGTMYQFEVRVADNGFPVQKSLTKVQIFVKRFHEELLTIGEKKYSVSVREDTPIKTYLLTVSAVLKGYNGTFRYSLIDGNLPYTRATTLFRINSRNGKLRTKGALDFETVRHHKLLVQAESENGDKATSIVHVRVENLNDNSPQFHSRAYKLKVAEDFEVGERLLQVMATDLDDLSPQNSTITYSVMSNNRDLFTIDKSTGWIALKKKLDYEAKRSHKISVEATDNEGKFDTTTVNLNVVDVNDSPPVFNKPKYAVNVKEDSLVEQTVLSVHAEDLDQDSTVRYYLLKSDSRNFAVQSSTGNVYLLSKLTRPRYSLTVVAYDGIHTNPVNIKVTVEDINNHNPVCKAAYYRTDIAENSPPGTRLVQVQATDDDPSDKQLNYKIQGDGANFAIDEKSGLVSPFTLLDFETQSRYHFKVLVQDGASHSCTADVFVRVLDRNDNPPRFAQPHYTATVRENATHATVVTQVKASDDDALKNRQLSYELINNANGAFKIEKQGIITVANPKAIRKSSKHTLTVKASDPLYTEQAEVSIIVIANTDTPPKFEKYSFNFVISENNELDKTIGNIKVTAVGSFASYDILMEIIDPTNSNTFSIGENGDLKILKSLDYEQQSLYTFSVKASYKSIPLSSMVGVEVRVVDRNDNDPVFKYAPYSTVIDENIRTGTFVMRVSAHDADNSKQNSEITYRIDTEENIPFAIDFSEGGIVVAGPIDREKQQVYTFDVVATDSGFEARSSRAQATVKIMDLNDNAPVVSQYNTSVIVQEGKKPGSELVKLAISDPDSPKNGAPFHCSLLSDDRENFDVTTEDDICVVRSKKVFDASVHKQYELTIRVEDSGVPKQYSDSNIKVIVVKESFNVPRIQNPKIFFAIVSQPYGVTTIGKVKIIDEDKNDIHQYRITGGTNLEYFSVQSMTGVIEGRPKKGSYTLTIEATDGKNSDTAEFKIIVNEIDRGLIVNSVAVTLEGIDVREFMELKIGQFVKLVAKVSGNRIEDVFIWSVRDVEDSVSKRKKRSADGMDVMKLALAVRMQDTMNYMEASQLNLFIVNHRQQFENLQLGVSVEPTQCSAGALVCADPLTCQVTLRPSDVVSPYTPAGYVGFTRSEKCYCSDGSEGPICHTHNPCAEQPCKAGERCVPTSAPGYHCECVDPQKCGQTGEAVTLSGQSYIKYKLSKPFDELFHSLSVHFRTEYNDGHLFHAKSKVRDYFKVEIREGYLWSLFDFGSGLGSIRINDAKVNDGLWHFMTIDRSGADVKLTLDRHFSGSGRAPGGNARIDINDRPIIFGAGLAEDGITTFSGFTGCLKMPKLNKNLLPFNGATDMVSHVEARSLKRGCHDSGLCAVKRCPQFSDCFNTFTSHKCVCLNGHHGISCISNLTCSDQPCLKKGRCTLERIGSMVSYKCNCLPGFAGGQCHIDLGECATKPCQNQGVCTPTTTGVGYVCACRKGYSGRTCQLNQNPCASSPCRNRGVCQAIGNEFKCICPSGRSGRRCSMGDNCQFTKCQNGASCTEGENSKGEDTGICSCTEGFTGGDCSKDVNECLRDGICASEGVCINTQGSFYCNCTDSAVQKCKRIDEPGKKFPLMPVIIGACAVLFLIVIVIIVVICCKRYRSRYHPTSLEPEVRKYPLHRYDPNHHEMVDIYPPNPPPRGVTAMPPAYFDDQASAMMYDPSMVSFSGTASPIEKLPLKAGSSRRTSAEYNSDEELKSLPGGYHWDYSEVPEDVINKQMSREGSRLGLEHEYGADYVDLPALPERPASRRSSLPGYSECDTDVPEIPELPQHVRRSRQSLRSSPYTRPRHNDATTTENYGNRYSLLSEGNDTDYYQDILENETNSSDITNVTRPYATGKAPSSYGRAMSEISDVTETSLNSDDDADVAGENDPLDPDNAKQIARGIKKLFKDIEEDFGSSSQL